MTVKELIEALSIMPPDAEVHYNDGPHEGQVFAFENDPRPRLESDGRVKL